MLLSNNSYCQHFPDSNWLDIRNYVADSIKNSANDFSDEEFVKFSSQNLKYKINNDNYSQQYLERAVDTCLSIYKVDSLSIVNSKLLGYTFYIKDTSYFRFIGFVNSIPNTEGNFVAYSKMVAKQIEAFGNPDERIHALLYYGFHFWNSENDSLFDFLYNRAYKIVGKQNKWRDSAKCIEAIANDLSAFGFFNNGIYEYEAAWIIYHNHHDFASLGRIEFALGKEYSSNSYIIFQEKAITHFLKSVSIYKQIGNIDLARVSDLIGASTSMEKFPPNTQTLANTRRVVKVNKQYFLNHDELFQFRHEYCYLLGEYFASKDDTESCKLALVYLNASFLELFNYRANELVQQPIYKSLYALAELYQRINNQSRAIQMIDLAVRIAKNQNDIISEISAKILRSSIYYSMNESRQAIGELYTAQTEIENSKNPPYVQTEVELMVADALRDYYSLNADSSNKYNQQFAALLSNNLKSLHDFSQVETNLDNISVNSILDNDHTIMSNLFKESTRRKQLIIVIIVTSIAIFFSIVFIRRRRRNQLKSQLEELNGLTKSKLHNLKNSFLQLSYLLVDEEYKQATLFSEKLAYQLSFQIDFGSFDNWTLENEFDLLRAFYETQKIMGKEIELTIDTGNVDTKSTKFIPDSLTTLLDNSIKHGFSQISEGCKVSIKCERIGKLLHLEISDNGAPSNPNEYFLEKWANSGLNILRRRVQGMMKLSGFKKYLRDSFKITTLNGTTVKLIFPYARKA